MTRPTTQQVHIDRPLTNVSIAYTPGIYIGAQVFPVVKVQKISDRYWTYGKGDWLRRESGVRAPGTRAPRADFGVSTALYSCIERAIAKPVPNEVQDNADSPMNPLLDATKYVTEQIYLEMETDIASEAFGANWSGSGGPSASWSASTSTPIRDVSGAREQVAGAIGREPNTGVMGRGLWRYVTENTEIVDRMRYNADPRNPAVATQIAVAALFGLDKLLVGGAIVNSANEGATDSVGYVWANNKFLIAYVTPSPALMTPSAGYTFAFADREISRFYEEQERNTVIEGRASWDCKLTAADAGYLLTSVI